MAEVKIFQNKIPVNILVAGIAVSVLVLFFSFGVISKVANDANVVGLPEFRSNSEIPNTETAEVFTRKNVKNRYRGKMANNLTLVQAARNIAYPMCEGLPSRECYGTAIFKYVTQKIRCSSEQFGEKELASPESVLEAGTGSSEDIALLTSSLLNAVGIKSAVVVTPGESFVIYPNPDALNLYDAVWRVYKERYTEIDFKYHLSPNIPQRILIKKDYSTTPLSIIAKSDHPINFITFKSEREANRYLEGKTYTPIYSGTRWTAISLEFSIRMPAGSIIVLETKTETDISVKGFIADEELIRNTVRKNIVFRKSLFGIYESVIVLSFGNGPDKKNRMISRGAEGMDKAIANRTFVVVDMDVLMGI